MTIATWIVGLHLLSLHSPNCHHDNRGQCVRYEKATTGIYAMAPSGLTFGGYTNSYGSSSAYAGWTFETKSRRFALLVAGVTGYRRAAVLPLIAPSVRFEMTSRTAMRIAGMPRFEKGGASVLHLAIEHRF